MEEDGSPGRQLNIHLDPENMAGVYANFANISFSDYEFTLTFARIDHEVEEGDIPGVVVARVNVSARFLEELLEAMQDSWSKWSSREGIRNLPEAPPREEDSLTRARSAPWVSGASRGRFAPSAEGRDRRGPPPPA